MFTITIKNLIIIISLNRPTKILIEYKLFFQKESSVKKCLKKIEVSKKKKKCNA